MSFISRLDKAIYYVILLYALASSISIAVANIAVSLAALLAIVRQIKEPIQLKIPTGLFKTIGVFLVMVLISAIFAYKPLVGFDRLWAYLYRMLPLILAIAFVKNNKDLIKVVVTMGISIFIADSYAIWQGVHGNYRANAFGAHPMILAGYLIQMIPLLLVVGLENKLITSKLKYSFISLALISCIALVYNGTRGGWIAVIIVLLLYGMLHIKRNKKIVMLFLAACLVVGICGANIPLIKERVNSITDMTNQSNSERILLWRSAGHMFIDSPVVGIGAGNFGEVYQPYYILPEAKEPYLEHAHNNFMHMLAETGLAGFSAFTLMFGYVITTMYLRYRRNPQDIWAAVGFLVTISLLTQGFTEYNFGNSAVIRMYWLILGLAYAGSYMRAEKADDVTAVKGEKYV